MDDRKWEELSEGEFEAMLGAGLPDLPPEGIVEEVTPWKRAWNRVLVGMALSTVTLNFWPLDTILPAVGVVLMLLGFRTCGVKPMVPKLLCLDAAPGSPLFSCFCS